MAVSGGSSLAEDRTIPLSNIGEFDENNLRKKYEALDTGKDPTEKVFRLLTKDSSVVDFKEASYDEQVVRLDLGDCTISKLPTLIFSSVSAVVDPMVNEVFKSRKLWQECGPMLTQLYGVTIDACKSGRGIIISGGSLEVEQCRIFLENMYKKHAHDDQHNISTVEKRADRDLPENDDGVHVEESPMSPPGGQPEDDVVAGVHGAIRPDEKKDSKLSAHGANSVEARSGASERHCDKDVEMAVASYCDTGEALPQDDISTGEEQLMRDQREDASQAGHNLLRNKGVSGDSNKHYDENVKIIEDISSSCGQGLPSTDSTSAGQRPMRDPHVEPSQTGDTICSESVGGPTLEHNDEDVKMDEGRSVDSTSGEKQTMRDQREDLSQPSDTDISRSFLIASTNVHIYVGDIREVQAEVIVNSTNQNLGIDVSRAAGCQQMEEGIIDQSKPEPNDRTVLPTAGTSPSRNVYENEELTIRKALKAGEGFHSIAILASYADVACLSKNGVSDIICSAMTEFCCKRNQTVLDIHLVATDTEVVRLIQQRLGSCLQEGNTASSTSPSRSPQSGTRGGGDENVVSTSRAGCMAVRPCCCDTSEDDDIGSSNSCHEATASHSHEFDDDDGNSGHESVEIPQRKNDQGKRQRDEGTDNVVDTYAGDCIATSKDSSASSPTTVYPSVEGNSSGQQHQHMDDNPGKEEKHNDSKDCPVCLEPFDQPVELSKCKHKFCANCLRECFKLKMECPICRMVYGKIYGTQPLNATMDVHYHSFNLPGYESCGTIVIHYDIPDGIQTEEHPHPGVSYRGVRRSGLLPDNREGKEVLRLLQQAFEQRLTFTVGRSVTTGQDNCVTWNDIHHKTSVDGGPARFGYPDPDYLARVTADLAAKGIV